MPETASQSMPDPQTRLRRRSHPCPHNDNEDAGTVPPGPETRTPPEGGVMRMSAIRSAIRDRFRLRFQKHVRLDPCLLEDRPQVPSGRSPG